MPTAVSVLLVTERGESACALHQVGGHLPAIFCPVVGDAEALARFKSFDDAQQVDVRSGPCLSARERPEETGAQDLAF